MGGKPSVVAFLEAGLNASTLRQKVIANNLANLNTPGFRRNGVEFEEILARQMDSPSAMKLADCKPSLSQPLNTPVKENGNDVNLDMEIGELMKSASRHKTYLRLLNKLYKQMEVAMQT